MEKEIGRVLREYLNELPKKYQEDSNFDPSDVLLQLEVNFTLFEKCVKAELEGKHECVAPLIKVGRSEHIINEQEMKDFATMMKMEITPRSEGELPKLSWSK
ncbi:MAG: hypothetical protein K2H53_01335 [Clostridia bacterium]|nr:hypothetical protein [Clostridia bacterium]